MECGTVKEQFYSTNEKAVNALMQIFKTKVSGTPDELLFPREELNYCFISSVALAMPLHWLLSLAAQ